MYLTLGGHSGWWKVVDSLAVATRIWHNYQVLSDDGNRIRIPQGNYKLCGTVYVTLPLINEIYLEICVGHSWKLETICHIVESQGGMVSGESTSPKAHKWGQREILVL